MRFIPLILFAGVAASPITAPAQALFSGDIRESIDSIPSSALGCDVASLNANLSWRSGAGQVFVSNAMPTHCLAYTNSTYADLSATLPMYVGRPDRGGRWVEPKDYAKALAAYSARIANEESKGDLDDKPCRAARSAGEGH